MPMLNNMELSLTRCSGIDRVQIEAATRKITLPHFVPLSELDKRYFAYAASQPVPLDRLALDRRLFTGKGEPKPLASLADVHPLVTCLPWLFHKTFPAVSEADLLDISEAGILLVLGLLLRDHDLDGQLPAYPEIPLLLQRLHAAAHRKFQTLFQTESPFWSHFDHYLDQYTTALLDERKHERQVSAYSLEKMYEIGRGKVALLKAMTTGLALKAQAERWISPLECAVDALTAAMQLADDIEDWAEDYENKRYTLPLTWVIPPEQWPTPTLTVTEIGQRLEDSFILQTLQKQVVTWLQQALLFTVGLPCPAWVEFVENCLTITRNYQRSLVAKKVLKIISNKTDD